VQPKTLLMQARNADDPMAAHEHRCFVDQTGLPAGNVVVQDLCAGPPSLAEVRGYDALMVGGSGDYYVSKRNLPAFDEQLEVLAEVVNAGHPTFASCFGFQLLTVALGGEIEYDPSSTEVGTYELQLTAAGAADTLLGSLPPRFMAQLGRKDRAARLPDGVSNLASSERSPHQAFRVPGQPVWATQFHPELDARTNKDRFMRYLDGYSLHMSPEEKREALSRFHESPETAALLPAFLRLIFGERRASAVVAIPQGNR